VIETPEQPHVIETPEQQTHVIETPEQPHVTETPEQQPHVVETPQQQPHVVTETSEQQPHVTETSEQQTHVTETPEQPHVVTETPEQPHVAIETPQQQVTTPTLVKTKMISTPELIMRGKGTTDDNNNLLQTAAKQIVHTTGSRNKYRAICIRLGVNLDANGKYMGARGPVYTQLQQAVRKMNDSLKKNKMSTKSLLLQKNHELTNTLKKTEGDLQDLLQKNAQLVNMLKGEVQNLLKKNAHLTNMLEKTKDELQDLRASVSKKKRKIPQMCSTNKKARSENDIDH